MQKGRSGSRSSRPAKSRRPTKGQLAYLRRLRREAGLPTTDPPKTWETAGRQIDRLLIQLGRDINPRVKRPEPKPLSNAQRVKLSVARDLAHKHTREAISNEQARLKLAAEQRRAARLTQHKPDITSAAD